MMMRDEFGEAFSSSSTSRSPSTPMQTLWHHSHSSHRHQNPFPGDSSSSSSRFCLRSASDYSLSSYFSNGLCSSEDGSSQFASPPFDGIMKTHYTNATDDYYNLVDDSGLCDYIHRLNIGEEKEEEKNRYEIHHHHNFTGNQLRNLGNHEPSDAGLRYVASSPSLFRKQRGSSANDHIPNSYANFQHLGLQSYGATTVNDPVFTAPEFYGWGQLEASYNPRYKSAEMSPLFCETSGRPMGMIEKPFISDNSLIMDADPTMVHGTSGIGTLFDHHQGSSSSSYTPKISEIQGYVYLMAKDQHGCRFLQRIFENGNALDVIMIFNEVIPHVVELMMDPFGNYLMQKLLDVCNEEQRTQIILMVTAERGQLIRISLDAYGTRVVQRLVESIKTRKQISLVKSALRPGFLNLIRDLNGNHVLQRCLQCLCTEDNEFIFEDATKFCIDIATHRHGCCVLQKCVAYSTGQQREKLITEISTNSLFLAQDPYGNYAVQFLIELRDFSAISTILAQLKGHYVELSMQKFSSHLVERCLTHCPESRPQIVRELISVPHFDHLIQDPYANFVIQAALAVTKGSLHATLVEVIRPHSILRHNPYCKRIFSRHLWKN